MQQPNDYPKRVLLAVSGMSPQIVTETLYSLAINKPEPFIPTEIHLITTVSGAKEARLQLLHPKTGKIQQLRDDYGLPDIYFPEENIHIIEDYQALPLDDIKTPAQNEAAADYITAIVSDLTRHDDTAIHVSIAGGRKTMGYYLGYALSLYGRPQDRLSHVLVTDRYESLKDFFYPTPTSQVIYDRDNRALDAKEAEIMLAEIPFVRLRGGIPEHLLDRKIGFSESVYQARRLESGPLLEIDLKHKCFYAKGVRVKMTDINYGFYLWMIQQTVELNRSIRRKDAESNQDYANSFLLVYERCMNEMKDKEKTMKALSKGLEPQWISERMSAVKKSFEAAIGKHQAKSYTIESKGNNNDKVYSVPLIANQIMWLDID